jgi:hypothetical protein
MKNSTFQNRIKFAGIGGIVFFTGVLAAFTSGVACNIIYGPRLISVSSNEHFTFIERNFRIVSLIFGIFWGTLIFNLYRFIVFSTIEGDGTTNITWSEFKKAIPRIIITIIIVFTISKPLEIIMLKSEIEATLLKKQQEKLYELNKLTNDRYKKVITTLDNDLLEILSERNALVESEKLAEKEYLAQIQGRSGVAGFGPRAKQLKDIYSASLFKISQFDINKKSQIDFLKKQRDMKLAEQEFELNQTNKSIVKRLDGFLIKFNISNEIGNRLGWAITLILMSIVTGPIIIFMTNKK